MPVEKVPSWIKQVLMPKLSEIKGEVKAINTLIDSVESQIGSLEERIDSLRNETKMEISSLITEMSIRLAMV
jgi:prefoldin subunit 5